MTDIASILVDGSNVSMPALRGYLTALQAVTEKFGNRSLGVLPAGTTLGLDVATSFEGEATGNTTMYDRRHILTVAGANTVTSARVQYNGTEIIGSANVLLGEAVHNYVWGKDASTAVNVRVAESHFVWGSSGNLSGTAAWFSAASITHPGAGLIAGTLGFTCADIGGPKVTNAFAFNAGDMTATAGTAAAFRSSMSAGVGKLSILSDGSASSVHNGKFAIGSTTAPTDQLEVKNGYLKVSSGAGFRTAAQSHEIRSQNNDFALVLSNAHASVPQGLDIIFDGAAPNNTTSLFLRARDTVGTKAQLLSTGAWQNLTNSYAGISDVNVKFDIEPASSQIDDVMGLEVVNYSLVDQPDYGRMIGFVAQEVEKISPGLVLDGFRDVRRLGSIEIAGEQFTYDFYEQVPTKSVQYSVANMKLFKAFQELGAIVFEQRGLIADLTSRISKLETGA